MFTILLVLQVLMGLTIIGLVLFFIGIPPAVAVATEANQIVASSFSGVLGHWRRGNVDFKMGLVIVLGGWSGGYVGVQLVAVLGVVLTFATSWLLSRTVLRGEATAISSMLLDFGMLEVDDELAAALTAITTATPPKTMPEVSVK